MAQDLPRYAFIPWTKKGLATRISEEEAFDDLDGTGVGRPTIAIESTVVVNNESVLDNTITKTINLIGPGDIIGFSHEAIVKLEPAEGRLNNFERNYFPYIEFYEEDFPWRYTPARSKENKLKPWLCLIVLKNDGSEYERNTEIEGYFPSITYKNEEALPNPSELWAWAHVQYTGDLISNQTYHGVANQSHQNKFKTALAANPDHASSRIICPRLLDPNTKYTAFLVPTYEAGRLAGLGRLEGIQDVPTQQTSFKSGIVGQDNVLPVYFEWEFTTGEVGDFEELVRKLKAQRPDPELGKRKMYMADPGYGINEDPDQDELKELYLEGALRVPQSDDEPERTSYPWPYSFSYRKELADFINLSKELENATYDESDHYLAGHLGGDHNLEDDPIVTADLYGRFHILEDDLNPVIGTSWIHELNLDPRNRAVAGLGSEYIKRNQDKLMDEAWGQLEQVQEANKKINWGQLGKEASKRGFKKNIEALSLDKQTSILAGVFGRVKTNNVASALGEYRQSNVPNAAVTQAFRKLERSGGRFMKRGALKIKVDVRTKLAPAVKTLSKAKSYSLQQSTINNEDLNARIDRANTASVVPKAANLTIGAGESSATTANVVDSIRLTQSYGQFTNYFGTGNWTNRLTRPALELDSFSATIRNQINPGFAIASAITGLMNFQFTEDQPSQALLMPIMAYPVFKQPVYEYVKDLGKEFLLPNLHLIKDNSITLLETNQRFIESLMVGLNHEMGKELLWRQYPTDQRGTYFRQFWDVRDALRPDWMMDEEYAESMYDIKPINTWFTTNEQNEADALTMLGENDARAGAPNNLVLVIRGELLRKYPNVVIYAQRAEWNNVDKRVPVNSEDDGDILTPIFKAQIEPDIYLLGFDLEEEEAKGSTDPNHNAPGWFFILRERPGEVRFGLDETSPEELNDGEDPEEWDDLNRSILSKITNQIIDPDTNETINGSHLKVAYGNNQGLSIPLQLDENQDGDLTNDNPHVFSWGENSAVMAQILYQNPVMLCIHADDMLEQS